MMHYTRGISLLELMVSLAIASIFFALAIPSAVELMRTQQRAQGTNQLISLLHFARIEAVLSRRTIGLCAGVGVCSGSKNWQGNLLVFVDTNLNGQLDRGEALLRQEPLDETLNWRWRSFQKRTYILFEADGTTRALNGTFTLCRHGVALSQAVVNPIGRVRTQSPFDQGLCS